MARTRESRREGQEGSAKGASTNLTEAPDPQLAGVEVVAAGKSTEFATAISALDFPMFICRCEANTPVIALANGPAEALTGYRLQELRGKPMSELIVDLDAFGNIMQAWASEHLDNVREHGPVRRKDGGTVDVVAWGRRVELDGVGGVVILVVPRAEVTRLGRDPATPWRQLVPVAVGRADPGWRVLSISADIVSVLGGSPSDWVGVPLPGLVDGRDSERVRQALATTGPWMHAFGRVGVHRRDGTLAMVNLLVSKAGAGPEEARSFAIIGEEPTDALDRVAELELRLRRIGAEVHAAGVMQAASVVPSGAELPALGDLTARQWEILSRLLRGLRAPTIAKELYLSPSTVRNHLTSIFRKFGVHSQPELLDLLRRRAGGTS